MSTEEKEVVLKPVVGVLLERSISHADKVFFPLIGIAQQGIPFLHVSYSRTDLVRNKMALRLLQSDFTHLIMLDIDHIHPVDIVQRLMVNFARHPELMVVGGLNFRRGEPFDPCAYVQGDDGQFYPMAEWEKGLVEVDAIGTGSIAISRKVFERIEPPWFWNDYSRVMEDVWPGEDMGFCKLLRDHVIKIHVDTTVTSPHLIDGVVEERSYRAYREDKGMKSIAVESVKKDA